MLNPVLISLRGYSTGKWSGISSVPTILEALLGVGLIAIVLWITVLLWLLLLLLGYKRGGAGLEGVGAGLEGTRVTVERKMLGLLGELFLLLAVRFIFPVVGHGWMYRDGVNW